MLSLVVCSMPCLFQLFTTWCSICASMNCAVQFSSFNNTTMALFVSDSGTRFNFASEAESGIRNKQLFGISFASEAESGFGSFLVQFPEAPQSVLWWWSWFAETASPLKRIHRWLKSKRSWNKQGMNDYIWLLHLVVKYAFPFLFNNN